MGWKAAQKVFKNWKILRGDKVMVMAGKDRGLTGNVQKVIREKNLVLVEGRNLAKKHVKRTENQPGGIVTIEAPIHVSNLSLLDPVTGAPCRAVFRWLEDGTKVRIAKGASSTENVIPRPEILKERKYPRGEKDGPKNTETATSKKLTWNPVTGEGGLPPLVEKNGRWEVDLSSFSS